MNLDLGIAKGDELKILWTDPQGDEVLIGNDESLQLALEISRDLYTPAMIKIQEITSNSEDTRWEIELPYALTGLYKSYSPFFTLRVINEGPVRPGPGPGPRKLIFYREALVNKKNEILQNVEIFTL